MLVFPFSFFAGTSKSTSKFAGPSVVFADMAPGQRLKLSVKSICAIGLDIDTGTPVEVVDAALKKLGCVAVRYSTHSNDKTTSEFRKDKVLKKFPEADEITSEMMQEFCTTVENWDDSIVDTAEFLEEDHTERGIVIRILHAPMPKHRVFVPIKNLFEVAKEGRTQPEAMAKWAKIPAALAEKLGVPFDRSCTDPSRLYYLPRHAKGKPFNVSLFGGPLFDWRTLGLEGEFDKMLAEMSKTGGKSKTDEGKKLGRWSMKTAHGFQIMDAIEANCPDKMRGKGTMGYNIECPFDEDHHNPGDTSDAACYAVNAAEGGNELFIVSCRHETCREYTNLDMLGKMLKDNWFEESVINDPDLNIAEPEQGAPNSTATNKFKGATSADADGVIEQNIQQHVDELTKKTAPEKIEDLLKLVAKAGLSATKEGFYIDKIAEKGPVKARALNKDLKAAKQEAAPALCPQDTSNFEKICAFISRNRAKPFQFPPEHFGEFYLQMVGDMPWMGQMRGEVGKEDLFFPRRCGHEQGSQEHRAAR